MSSGGTLRFSSGRDVKRQPGEHDHEPVELALVDLADRLADPKIGPKGSAGYYLPAIFARGKRGKGDAIGGPCVLTVDLDEGDWTADAIRGAIPERVAWIAHTTASHTPQAPRWRVVFPIAPVTPVFWSLLSAAVGQWFGTDVDHTAERLTQPIYWPTITNESAEFLVDGDLAAPPLGGVQAAKLVAEEQARLDLAEAEARREREAREAARKARRARLGIEPGPSVVDAWNAAHGIEETLERFGYGPPRAPGGRWLAPNSQSGRPAVVVYPDEGRFYSHHRCDADTPLEHGDAFDLFVQLEHGGDFLAAVKAAARELNLDERPQPAAQPAPKPSTTAEANGSTRPAAPGIPFTPAWGLDAVDGLAAPYWIKGIIDAGATGYLFGKFSVGKTFAALEMASSVADGRPFLGRRTRQGLVFYSCGEGALGIRRRVRALRLEGRLESSNLMIRDRAVDLREPAHVVTMIEDIRAAAAESSRPVGLIFLDTQRRHMGAGEENPGPDTAALFDSACALREAFPGASVVIVAHEGHSADRLRGHSNQGSDADFLIRLSRDGDSPAGRLSIEKSKDEATGAGLAYRLRVVDLGVPDIDGEPLTSCVVDPIEIDEERAAKPLAKHEAIVRNAIEAVLSVPRGTSLEGPDSVRRGTLLEWVEGNAGVTREQRRGVVHKGLKGLKSRGLVEVQGQDVFLLGDLP